MAELLSSLKNRPSIVILLGPPGSGKGTQASSLSAHLGIPHISTGDLFRYHMKEKTAIGGHVKEFMDQGRLVPDPLVFDMVFHRLAQEDCQRGAILDGFPRTKEQAEMLDRKIHATHQLTVFQFSIDSAQLVERITGRLACRCCGRSFHKTYDPPARPNMCDACDGALYQRSDDTEEILRKRLDVYYGQTEPLIKHYKLKPDSLYEIQGHLPKDQVFCEIIKIMQSDPILI